MHRRALFGALAGSAAWALAGCATSNPTSPTPQAPVTLDPGGPHTATPLAPPATPAIRFPAPTGIELDDVPRGSFSKLPGEGDLIALTVDDGEEISVLRAYADLARRTGIRLTFFVNGAKRAWSDIAPVMRPLVESGQVLLGNHGWSHEDLTELSSKRIKEEIRTNEDFLNATYGVTGRPFLRPPFGAHNSKVREIAKDLGFPAITLWNGSLGDSSKLAPATIVENARTWFRPQSIVLGHADFPAVNGVLDQLTALMRERGLQPVHLGDVFDIGHVQTPTASPSVTPTPTPDETETPTASETPMGSPSPSPSTRE